MRVAVQPARLADPNVRKHFEDTIDHEVVFDEHDDLLEPAVRSQLEALFPQGSAPMWGVLPGRNDANLPKVGRFQAGDFVLFYGEKKCYLAGTVAVRWRSQLLAQRLWTDNKDSPPQTWEHMYALAEVRKIDVSVEELRPILGWKVGSYAQGFNVYDGDKAERLSELCNLDPNDLLLPTADQADDPSPQPGDDVDDSPLERLVARMLRKEQGALKRRLIELGANTCALCGLRLPKAFLVAAHIKRRSECTNREKLDFDNVAMLACLLGCDSLFEHGYVAVQPDGRIVVSPLVKRAPAVSSHVTGKLDGRVTSWWSEQREPYFAWHRNHTFKTTP